MDSLFLLDIFQRAARTAAQIFFPFIFFSLLVFILSLIYIHSHWRIPFGARIRLRGECVCVRVCPRCACVPMLFALA